MSFREWKDKYCGTSKHGVRIRTKIDPIPNYIIEERQIYLSKWNKSIWKATVDMLQFYTILENSKL